VACLLGGKLAFWNDLLAGQAGKYELGTIFDGIHGDGVRRFYDEHAVMALRNTIILGYILAGGDRTKVLFLSIM
jgi:hypothetical protein